jgi:hypothetical protein
VRRFFVVMLPLFALAAWTPGGQARAEILSFGLKGGVPFNDVLNVTPQPTFPFVNSNRYTLGPAVELHLPAGLGVEVDALYKSAGFRSATGDVSGNAWDFPLLLKARMLKGPLQPYAEAGATFRRLGDLTGVLTLHPSSRVNTGLTLGGGIELKALIIRLSGEVRYTRFVSDVNAGTLSNVRFDKNQAEVLFGITF